MAVAVKSLSSKMKMTPKRKSDIEKAKKKLRPVSEPTNLTLVVYGRNKQGKTRFACDSDLKTLLIDCNEKGWASVRRYKNVTRYSVGKFEEIDPIYWLLRAGDHDFDVVIIDTVTSLATICMKWVLKDDADRDMNRDPLTPDQRSWGKLGEAIKDVIIKFRNLAETPGIHVIFLAQEKTTYSEEDDGTTNSEVHPELSPSPRSTLLSAVDIIGRIYVREVEDKKGKKQMERRMLLGAHPKYVAGNRYDELKYVERNPTFGGFLEKITGGK